MKGAVELSPRKSETGSDLPQRVLLAFQTLSKAQSGMWTDAKVSGASKGDPDHWTSADSYRLSEYAHTYTCEFQSLPKLPNSTELLLPVVDLYRVTCKVALLSIY